MPYDYYDRITRLADKVHHLLIEESATVSEMRDVFKRLQERANGEKMPPCVRKPEAGGESK